MIISKKISKNNLRSIARSRNYVLRHNPNLEFSPPVSEHRTPQHNPNLEFVMPEKTIDDQELRNTNNVNPVLNQNQNQNQNQINNNNTLHNSNLEFVLPGEKTKPNNNNDNKFNTNNNTLNLHQDKQINNNDNNVSKDGVYASKTAAHYNLKSLASHLKELGLLEVELVTNTKRGKRDFDFLHLKITQQNSAHPGKKSAPYFLLWNDQNKDIYWFENGVIVAWGITSIELSSIESFVAKASTKRLDVPFVDRAKFSEKTNASNISNVNSAFIDSENDQFVYSNGDQQFLFSYCLARSVSLNEIEFILENEVSQANQLVENPLSFDFGKKDPILDCRNKLFSLTSLNNEISLNGIVELPLFLERNKESKQFSLLLHEVDSYLDLKVRSNYLNEKIKFTTSVWNVENSHYVLKRGWRLQMMIAILLSIIILLKLLERSSGWNSFSFEKFSSNKWNNLMGFFGFRSCPPISGNYEIYEETIVLDENGKKKETKHKGEQFINVE